MTIYLVRHGQTEFNAVQRWQGQVDSPLTELGRKQAQNVGKRLRELIDPVETHVFCKWDGMTDYEIDHEFPGMRDGLGRQEWFFHAPDGETFDSMSERVSRGLTQVEAREQRNAVVICHGVTGRILRGIYAGLSKEETLHLEVPQDAFFHLKDGAIFRIDC